MSVSANERSVCEIVNPHSVSDWFIVCEHASSYIPENYQGLGLNEQQRASHIAWDPGAAELARSIAALLKSTAVLHNYSRLLYDCNRPPSAASAIPERSEATVVPGNQGLTEQQRANRVDAYYTPFHDLIDHLFEKRESQGLTTRLVTIHSFTPVYMDKKRRVQLGILMDENESLGRALFKETDSSKWQVEMNEPYSARDGVTHLLQRHGESRSIDNVMLEIRNDLLDSEEAVRQWAYFLSTGLLNAQSELQSSEQTT